MLDSTKTKLLPHTANYQYVESFVTKIWKPIFNNYEQANDLAEKAETAPPIEPSDPYYLGQEKCPITKIKVELNLEVNAHEGSTAGKLSGSSSLSDDWEEEKRPLKKTNQAPNLNPMQP